MGIGPIFSANKFQSVIKSALGVGSDGVKSALSRIGKQDVLKSPTSVANARKIFDKLDATGAINDSSRARNEFRKAERVAEAAHRIRQSSIKADRHAQYFAQDVSNQSVVRDQLHSVSIAEDAESVRRAVSVSQIKKEAPHKVHGALSKDAGTQAVIKPLLDIPFD